MADKGQKREGQNVRSTDTRTDFDNFVLEKSIFSNIFEKDIRRVYIYKKTERLAKAIHLIAPAFKNSPALRDRLDLVAIGLVDSAILPPTLARGGLSRELLTLSSVLSIARTGGLLSSMNAELIAREAHLLLQEIASYEEPRLFLEESPSLASLAKDLAAQPPERRTPPRLASPYMSDAAPGGQAASNGSTGPKLAPAIEKNKGQTIGQISDKLLSRREAILSVLTSKGPSYIKDISTVIRDVSEKTIQRELQALVEEGSVSRTGERRWTTYEAR
jgi:DNA-binding transcriptional ArsR family regulator